ncbi:MAG: 50S ribosomal protein L24 [Omnitrophica WOR_2 bacterium SM23_29]|nr:MAG: 50S ribosomal protein L24 [Omnitrophica WOR_2 bacterium SM23_29]
MFNIKKNDTVMVIKGKDRGKTGRVMKVLPKEMRAIVEGRNLTKKHVRRTRAEQQVGIIQIENPIHLSNLMPMCPKCNKPTRIGFIIRPNGDKTRICRRCKEALA